MSQQLFVTGMMRSGTSLAQIILTNHPKLFVASQPFHQLYVDVKQLFLNEYGLKKLLPLGDGLDADTGERELFSSWLNERRFDEQETARLVEGSITGKGGDATNLTGKLSAKPGSFFSIRYELHQSLAKYFNHHATQFIGSKDAFCEEYIPSLVNNNIRCLIIIRDPRAVIASACHGRYHKQVGDRYPLLMLIRLWRKSAAYWLAFRNHPLVHTMRYEDLVQHSGATLNEISKWLDIDCFPNELISQPLHDHTGKEWKGNSSFGEKNGVDAKSRETWRTLLKPEEVRFIEACTKPELTKLGYSFSKDLHRSDIADFFENTDGVREAYLTHYQIDDENRNWELQRWDAAEQGQFVGIKNAFLFPEVFT